MSHTSPKTMPPAHPFDTSYLTDAGNDDKLKEECGVFGVVGVADAANFVALGLHALQHRGQEAGGIVTYDAEAGFQSARRFGYVRDNFTSQKVMETLPGPIGIGHVRYSTSGSKGQTAIRDVQPFFGEFAMGGAAIAHNGNITNANALRRELIERGSIFQSSSDSECIIHLMARSLQRNIPERMEDALRRVEGAFSIVAMTRTKLIGVRDPLGVRPLVLGKLGDGYALSSSRPNSASSSTSISPVPTVSWADVPSTKPARRSAVNWPKKHPWTPIWSAPCPIPAPPPPSVTAWRAASPMPWASSATSIWAARSSSRQRASATWVCVSS